MVLLKNSLLFGGRIIPEGITLELPGELEAALVRAGNAERVDWPDVEITLDEAQDENQYEAQDNPKFEEERKSPELEPPVPKTKVEQGLLLGRGTQGWV